MILLLAIFHYINVINLIWALIELCDVIYCFLIYYVIMGI